MAVKTKKKSSTPSFFKTGMNEKQFIKEMKGNQSTDDPEFLRLFDGDQATVTFVSSVKDLVRYKNHYLGRGAGGGYKICSDEDGCPYCDDGNRASKRALVVVYVHQLFKAENENYPAKKTKNVGYRYFVLNQETADGLVKRAQRRGSTFSDRIYVMTREGAGTDTKFDMDRTERKTDPAIIKGNTLNAAKKIVAMFGAEQGGKKKKSKSDDDDDDEDYDLGDDFDVDDDDEDEDEAPKRKKKSKTVMLKKSRR